MMTGNEEYPNLTISADDDNKPQPSTFNGTETGVVDPLPTDIQTDIASAQTSDGALNEGTGAVSDGVTSGMQELNAIAAPDVSDESQSSTSHMTGTSVTLDAPRTNTYEETATAPDTSQDCKLPSGSTIGADFDALIAFTQEGSTTVTTEPHDASYQIPRPDDMEAKVASDITMDCMETLNAAAIPQSDDLDGTSSPLFCSDNEEDGTPMDASGQQHPPTSGKRQGVTKKSAPSKRSHNPKRKGTTILMSEKRKNAATVINSYGNRQNKKSTANGIRKGNSSTASSQGKKRGPRKQRRQNVNVDSLLLPTSNAVALAQANSKEAKLPGFSAKAKDKAVKEIIDQVKDLDRDTASMDRTAIMEAITRFKKRPKADGNGGWIHSDMKTSFLNYQLLGVGFMRDRENSHAAPHGGFLCDEMGFGKTIQAIANIVDGKAERDEEPKATLIVAPAHLVNHWKNEISKHAKEEAVNMVLTYHASHRPEDGILQALLRTNELGVLITTYGEIRRSCPDFKQPPDPNKKDEVTAWTNYFYENCGFFHRTPFRRVILDEAHEIRNHMSKTSMAVRMLSARFRWVVTGTPLLNEPEEYFAYFDFLKIPQTGTFEKFRRTYCPENSTDRSRLKCVLGAYMMRRTHEDKLFNLPLLSLPYIQEQNFTVHFSKAESYIYRTMTVLCVKDLFDLARRNETESLVFSSYLTMLLRLRMFTSHLLSVHQVLKKLLTRDMIHQVRVAMLEDGDPEDLETCYLLEKLAKKEKLPELDALQEVHPTGNRWSSISRTYSPSQWALITSFRTKLNSTADNGTEALEMTKCKICGEPPFDGYIMSCMHVTCHPCMENLNSGDVDRPNCGCGAVAQEFAFYHTIGSLKDPVPTSTSEERNERKPGILTGDDIERSDDDWVLAAGHLMQGAKLKAVRSCVIGWFEKSKEKGDNAKIIIFTQFLSMVHILSAMCESEDWGYVTLTGKDSPKLREGSINAFRKEPDIRIMIASLKAGGTGLNLTMATRCILVDLWWNEAVEQQAFCRLYRIGQKKDVEFVRISVHNSIDDRLQMIQNSKTRAIDEVMGPKVLSARDTLANALQLCGMREDENDENGFSFDSDNDEPLET